MDSDQTTQYSESTDSSSIQIAVLAATATVAAALVAIATYLYFIKRAANSPQGFLDRCRNSIDNIEHGMNNAGYA